jgi:arylsulfatase A-like enzyme
VNIVVIVSDTFRRDRLSCYREPAVLERNSREPRWKVPWPDRIAYTPNLDRLAQRSAIFDRYYASGFPTMPTRADLLTGTWTFSYMSWEPLPRSAVTVSQLLADAGYVTAGVVDTPFYTKSGYGYDRGFNFFYDLKTQGPPNWDLFLPQPRVLDEHHAAPSTFNMAERVLEHISVRHPSKPFFLWVDTWDPHEPWEPPVWYGRRYDPNYKLPATYKIPPYYYYKEAGQTDEDLEAARIGYLGEITMVDRYIGRLLERLESLGVLDDTAVFFLTDHGFYFGEHGGILGKMLRPADHPLDVRLGVRSKRPWARSPLYEEIAHIPLLIALPQGQQRRIPELTSAIDVMPTILELAGVEPPPELKLHGRSLAGLARGEGGSGREFVVTTVPLANPGETVRVVDSLIRELVEYQPATITSPKWSLLYSAAGERVELFDLNRDPGQQEDVSSRNPEVVRDLHGRYASLLRDLDVPAKYLEPRLSL